MVQDVLGFVPMEFRQGFEYLRLRNFLLKSQYWHADKITQWQFERLTKIINKAYNETDGYRQLYDEEGVRPKDLQTLSDLKYFPQVNKSLMQDNVKSFTSKKWSMNNLYLSSTSGSSAEPFSFYNVKRVRFEYSFMFLLWKWFGHNPNELAAVLKGEFGDDPDQLYDLDRYYNSLLLSSSQLSRETLPLYLKLIRKHDIHILRALPSTLYLLCQLLREIDRSEWPLFKVISISSENNYDWQFRLFKKTFPNARIFSWYGHAEQALLAPFCEKTDKYHLWPFYGIAEIMNNSGNEVIEGEVGRLFGTSLFCEATYFIRYDTGDNAEKGASFCQECGRNFQLLNRIEGRAQEFVLTKTGRKVSVTVLNLSDQTYEKLKQFQFYQDRKGILVFKYVPKVQLSASDQAALTARLQRKIGTDIEIRLEQKDRINRTQAGKYIFMDQQLPLNIVE